MSNRIKIKKKKISTLTYRIAALQVKMLHIQLRMRKIYEDQKIINEKMNNFKSNRELIKGSNTTIYSSIDMIITMEHLHQLVSDIFATKEITQHFDKEMYKILNSTRDITKKWKYVRNKIGGHIDMDVAEDFCEKHNFKGVFISEDLETDLSAINMLLLESAINSARKSSDIFGRDLELKNNLAGEIGIFVNKLNSDWNTAFAYFKPLSKLMYSVGKKEKIAWAGPDNIEGIITGD